MRDKRKVAATVRHSYRGYARCHIGAGDRVAPEERAITIYIYLQIAALIERARTHVTLVRRVLHVQDTVHGQRPRLAEAFATFTCMPTT